MPHQTKLTQIYRDWRDTLPESLPNIEAKNYSAPLLMNMPTAYQAAERRILFCGQETLGWGHKESPDVGNTAEDSTKAEGSLTSKDVEALADFLSVKDSVDVLLRSYEEFAFAKTYSGRSSPFWRAFRQVQAWNKGELAWTNLSKFDYLGKSISDSPNLSEIINLQIEIFQQEVQIADPHIVLFLTGPNYDWMLKRFFPEMVSQPLNGDPAIQQLSHALLPKYSFRTYHPRYLQQSNRWKDLTTVHDAITQAS